MWRPRFPSRKKRRSEKQPPRGWIGLDSHVRVTYRKSTQSLPGMPLLLRPPSTCPHLYSLTYNLSRMFFLCCLHCLSLSLPLSSLPPPSTFYYGLFFLRAPWWVSCCWFCCGCGFVARLLVVVSIRCGAPAFVRFTSGPTLPSPMLTFHTLFSWSPSRAPPTPLSVG